MLSMRARLLQMINWLTHAIEWARILELWCWKCRKNLGIRMSRPATSSWSCESSQIFCSAPNAPSHAPYSGESSCWHNVGNSCGHDCRPLLDTMVVIRMPMVARMSGDGSPRHWRHSRLMNSRHQSGNLSKNARALFFRIRPLRDRVASSSENKKDN